MDFVLNLYLEYGDWINLAKDAVFFFGAIGIVKYLFNRRFEVKSNEIKDNLKARDNIEDKLNEYVFEKYRNGVDVAVRCVYWKNYPWNLGDDGYKHLLFVRADDERTLPSGWIDNTGINFEEPLSFFGNSIYVDKNGIFFIAKKESRFEGFKELAGKRLVMRLPFFNIVNFDFKTRIEYEPIFYIKYRYDDFNKLYSYECVCRERSGEDWFRFELDRRYQLKQYSLWRYALMRIKIFMKKKYASFSSSL